MINKKTVFVGISGGVDSSVSAAILKDQSYKVVGVFIRTWTPDFIDCTWRDERRDAMRVCAHLGIPFLECDAEKEYKENVADYMIEEYKKGRTPNPDVMCNRQVKFGVFWKFAKSHGADYIATGHYVINDLLRTDSSSRSSLTPFCLRQNGTPPPVASQGLSVLRKSPDESKDQSYFLWTLTQEDLSHTLFPIGHLKKTEVRKLAEKYKLPTAIKKDSQGVCFLGPLDMKNFLRHYIKEKRGDVLNEKGEIIGEHLGSVFFTLGERHGFTITKKSEKDKPYYVVAKDIKKNIVTVSTKPSNQHTSQDLKSKFIGNSYVLSNINWIIKPPIIDKNYISQIRYHGELLSCQVIPTSRTGGKIIFNKNVLVDSGQSIVIYDHDVCLGGGIVE
jgi:tRNA-uridine 2-sulfurtransferase